MDRGPLPVPPPRVVPLADELLALGRGHQAQIGEGTARLGGASHEGGEQGLEVAQHALGGGGVEEIAVVLDRGHPAVRPLGQGEAQLELRGAACGRQGGERQPLQRGRRSGAFCTVKKTWKSGERCWLRCGLQLLDQLLERHLLVGEGAERGLAHAAEEPRDVRVAVQADRAAPGC